VRGRGHACAASVRTGREQRRDLRRREATAADVDQRAGEDAHHVHHERLALDLERQQRRVARVTFAERQPQQSAERAFARVRGGAERAEVVGAGEQCTGLAHSGEVDERLAMCTARQPLHLVGHVPGAVAQQRLARATQVEEVAVRLVAGVEARIVVGRAGRGVAHRDVVGQVAVERQRPALRHERTGAGEGRHLSERVHARVRARHAAHHDRMPAHALRGLRQRALHRALPGLRREASEAAAVVRDRDPDSVKRHCRVGHADLRT
jgi:hypothetical protein